MVSKFTFLLSCCVASLGWTHVTVATVSAQTRGSKLTHVSSKYVKSAMDPYLETMIRTTNERAFNSLKEPFLMVRPPFEKSSSSSSSSSSSKSPYKVVTDNARTTKFFLNDNLQVVKVQYLQKDGKTIKVVDDKRNVIKYMIPDQHDPTLWIHMNKKGLFAKTIKKTKLIKDEKTGTTMLLENNNPKGKENLYSAKWVQDSDGDRFAFSPDHKKLSIDDWKSVDFAKLASNSKKNRPTTLPSEKNEFSQRIMNNILNRILHGLDGMKGKNQSRPMEIIHAVAALVIVALVGTTFHELNDIEQDLRLQYLYYSENIPKRINEKIDRVLPPTQSPFDYLKSNPEIMKLKYGLDALNHQAIAA